MRPSWGLREIGDPKVSGLSCLCLGTDFRQSWNGFCGQWHTPEAAEAAFLQVRALFGGGNGARKGGAEERWIRLVSHHIFVHLSHLYSPSMVIFQSS